MSKYQPAPNRQNSLLLETRRSLLAEQLIKRGARTPTIHRLTGIPESTIRSLYHELVGGPPSRGPSTYSYLWFTEAPKRQWAATLAGNHLRHLLDPSWSGRPGDLLGEAYVNAYDMFTRDVSQFKHYANEINFERFASLGAFLAKRNPLDFMTCKRCPRSFIGQIHPHDGIRQTICPTCLIMQGRDCAHCGVYVPLQFGDFPPSRAPCCVKCAVGEERITTLEAFLASRTIYGESSQDEHLEAATAIVTALRSRGIAGKALSRSTETIEH